MSHHIACDIYYRVLTGKFDMISYRIMQYNLTRLQKDRWLHDRVVFRVEKKITKISGNVSSCNFNYYDYYCRTLSLRRGRVFVLIRPPS